MFRPFNPDEWKPSSDGKVYLNIITGDMVKDSVYKEAIQGKPEGINIIRGLIPISNDKSEGKKYDKGKPMVGTILRIFPRALSVVGAIIEYGTHKYPDPDNWSKNKNIPERYMDSAIRHLLKYFMGDKFDEESGLPHLGHALWNVIAVLEYELRQDPELVKKIVYPKEDRDES